MMSGELPNWWRILLLLMSLLSFLPQLRVLLVRRDSSGISPFYVLYNLISTTEQFTHSFAFVVVMAWDPSEGDVVIHYPPSLGDWINLGHFTVVWVLWLVVFALTLSFLPGYLGRRLAVLAIYAAYLLISVIPEFLYAADISAKPGDQDFRAPALFVGLHMVFVIPVTTVLCITAVFLQARELLSRPPGLPSPLSIASLGLQAVVFTLVAISWLARLPFPSWRGYGSLSRAVMVWYCTVAWHTINNGIFAAGQVYLLWLIVGSHRGRNIAASSNETEPLLNNRG